MFENLQTPCYVVDEKKLRKNLEILREVQEQSGCRILLAQKAFSMFRLYPMIGEYLCGTTASGIYEARLGHEEMGKENHVFAPAYKEAHMKELVQICDHVIFNSFAQYEKYRALCRNVSVGIRVNPKCSTQKDHAIYDPCASGSRLGVTREQFREELAFPCEGKEDLRGIDGLHFHTLCEQNADDLITTFKALEEQFSEFLPRLKWLNLGGGHHITREDYDRKALIDLVRYIRQTYDVEVYLEPGEAVVLNAGFLVSSVLETMKNGMNIAILDTSAACHMPDVLEMPYRPPVLSSGMPGEKEHTYRLAGPTCLAGDVIGDYSFDHPLAEGEQVVFGDMALYTMVKTNTFNGMILPSIVWRNRDGEEILIKEFGYEDFKGRLG